MFRKWFDQTRKAEEPQTMTVLDFGCGDFSVDVVGESRYQDDLRTILRQRPGREVAVLVLPELDNPYDKHAVRIVDAEIVGTTVGYLPRDNAEVLQPLIRAVMEKNNLAVACKARLFGGEPEKPSIGIWLDLDIDELEQSAAIVD